MTEREDQICAICRWNKETHCTFSCSNPQQTNQQLKNHINYNDSCNLFEERDEDYYEESNDLKLIQ